MALHHFSTCTVAVTDYPEHYWRGELVPHHTIVTDGYTDFHVHGDTAGANLFVFMDGHFLDLDSGVTDHASAVAWCERQFVRKPVTV